MKKQLLRSLALIGGIACALTASAEKRYLQVTSESQLQTGGQYVIGVVGTNADQWGSINPLCYTANANNTALNRVSAANGAFTEAMEWIAILDESGTHVCHNTNANHTGSHKVFQFTRVSGSDTKAMRFNGTTNTDLVSTTELSSYIEVVPVPVASSGLTNDPVFQFHTNWNGTRFNKLHMVAPNGGYGWYTRDNDTQWDILNGNSGNATNCWSVMHRIYLVIDSENLSVAANALWKSFQEEEVVGKGDSYTEKINALEVPSDLTRYSANTIETELKRAFKQAVFELDADLITTLSAAHVNRSGSGTYTSCLTGNDGCYVKMTSTSPTDSNNFPNNMALSNGKFACYSGNGISAGDGDYHSLYTVESFYPTYTVSGISFTASTSGAEEKIIIDGVATPLTSEEQTFICDGSFIIKGKNQTVLISDITVKLTETSTSTTAPTETGWYEITLLKGVSHTYAAFTSFSAVNKKITNVNDEYRQSNTNFYALKLADDDTDKPASTYIRFVKDGNSIKAQSANGHFVTRGALSKRTQSETDALTFTAKDNHTYLIGTNATNFAKWTYWNSGGAETPYIGASSNIQFNDNQWAIYRVNPAETYDIWSVTITGAPNATEIGNDVRVQCTSNANKGIAKVYNNGTFFITRGTNLTENDFVADDDQTDELTPILTVNNTDKTVTVNYVDKAGYLAYYKDLINNLYAPYAAQTIYDDVTMIEKAVNAHYALVETAAGEDAVITSDEVTGIKNALNNAETFSANVATFNKSLDGKLVQLRNYNFTGYYLADRTNNNADIAASITDRTSLNTIWQLALADENAGTLYLKNYADGQMIQNVTQNTTNIPMSATEGHPFVLESYLINGNPVFGIKDTQAGNHTHYIHRNKDYDIIKWNAPANSPASGWVATPAEHEDVAVEVTAEVKNETDGRGWIMTLSHADGLSLHSAYNEALHAIKVTYKEPASRADNDFTLAPTLLQHNADDNTVSFVLSPNGELLPDSDYDVQIPLAAVKVGTGKYSKPLTASIHVAEDGTVTGINEVKNAAANAPAAIFDLQGRRLSKPAKGINIINGRKVLVK